MRVEFDELQRVKVNELLGTHFDLGYQRGYAEGVSAGNELVAKWRDARLDERMEWDTQRELRWRELRGDADGLVRPTTCHD